MIIHLSAWHGWEKTIWESSCEGLWASNKVKFLWHWQIVCQWNISIYNFFFLCPSSPIFPCELQFFKQSTSLSSLNFLDNQFYIDSHLWEHSESISLTFDPKLTPPPLSHLNGSFIWNFIPKVAKCSIPYSYLHDIIIDRVW